jgi:ABC-2 type transport system ATP-binding protein
MSELAISVRGLAKSFNGRTIVQDCSIDVPSGSIYGFLGPNGTGKTTTIRMLCGLLTPDAGEGTCLGHDLRREARRIRRETGYMTQRFGLYEDLTIRENLEFVARVYAMAQPARAAAQAIERLGLANRREQLARTLSGGWKQRLALAACILHQPRLLLLDEPTAGVDPKARRDFWDEIHALAADGITILVSTHYMDEAERCHRIGYLSFGRLLVDGPVDQVVAQSAIATWTVRGANAAAAAARIRALPGVITATAFGAELHVSAATEARIEPGLRAVAAELDLTVAGARPTLEDVFIHTMAVGAAAAGAGKAA